jgi:adenosylhomocysteinase
MDMSFAMQALSLRHMLEHGKGLAPGVYDIPADLDSRVARWKLEAMGLSVDSLTPEQSEYLNAF